jgi:protocatechuate 3,4-dioxygenase beta subunit
MPLSGQRFITGILLLSGVLALVGLTAGQAAERSDKAVVIVQALSLEGKPVADVKLTLQERAGFTSQVSRQWSGTTGKNGQCRIEILDAAPHGMPGITVEAPEGSGLAVCRTGPREQIQLSPGTSATINVLLAPANCCLGGTVTNTAGRGIAGATVTASLGAGFARLLTRSALTDAQGRYRIEGLCPGRYTISSVTPPDGANAIGLQTWRPSGVRMILVADEKTAKADFRLAIGGRIVGRVLDESGKPVAGATVKSSLDEATAEGPNFYTQTPTTKAVTDQDGGYILGGLPKETYRVSVSAPKDRTLASAVLRGIDVPQEGDVKVQDITLEAAGTLVCEVVDPAGKVVPGARVTLGGQDPEKQLSLLTDELGHCSFEGLQTGSYWGTVQPATGSTLPPMKFADAPVLSGLSAVRRIMLTEGARIEGVVLGPEEKPVPGARVVLANHGGVQGTIETRADASGKFSFAGVEIPSPAEGLPAAHTQPRLSASGSGDLLTIGSASIACPPLSAGRTATVKISLPLAAGVTGLVTAPDGKPVAECKVMIGKTTRGARIGHGQATTDSRGVYRLGGLPAGQWSVTVAPPRNSSYQGTASREENFSAGKVVTMNLKLQRGHPLTGRVVDDSGQPVAGAEVILSSRGPSLPWAMWDHRGATAWSGPDGSFRVDGLFPGTYEVGCDLLNPLMAAERPQCTIQPGAANTVQIRAHLMGGISGELRNADGSVFKAAPRTLLMLALYAGEDRKRPVSQAYLDAAGAFEFASVKPGTYTLVVTTSQPGQPGSLTTLVQKEVTIKPGKQDRVDLQLPAMRK